MPRLRMPLWLLAAAVLSTTTTPAYASGLGPNRTRVRTTARSGGASAVVGKWKWGPECGAAYTIKGATPTWTRNATESYECGGVLSSAAANQPAVTASGAQVFAGYTQDTLQTSTIATGSSPTAPWSANACTVLADQYVAKDGTTTADRIACSAAGGSIFQLHSHSSTVGPFTASAWVQSDSGTADMSVGHTCGTGGLVAATSCTCGTSDNRACNAYLSDTGNYACVAYTNVGTTPVRLWVTHTCASAGTTSYVLLHAGRHGSTTATGGYWRANRTLTAIPMPSLDGLGSPVSAPADVPTVASGLVDPSKWAISTTLSAATWSPASDGRIWAWGAPGGADSALLTLRPGGDIWFDVYDATGKWKRCAATGLSLTALSEHTAVATNDNGTLDLWVDGSSNCTHTDNGGSGLLTTIPATTYIGNYGGGSVAAGYYRQFVTCKSANPARCR